MPARARLAIRIFTGAASRFGLIRFLQHVTLAYRVILLS